MKTLKSLPNNAAFFERYAELITSLSNVATIAQIITGACEVGILFSLLYSSFSDIVPSTYLNFVAMIGACVCASMLQLGLKKVFPYAVRAVLHKHFKGLDLPFSIGIFILTVTLLTASVYLSFNGSKEIAELTVKKPIEKTTDKTETIKKDAVFTALNLFKSDSTTIETKYKGKAEATETESLNVINSVERNAHGKQATKLRAELKTKLAKLQSDKAAEIETKATERNEAIKKANDRNDREASEISNDNRTVKDEAMTKKAKYKNYIGYFTLMCYIFFLSIFVLNEIHNKGSKIETKPLPSQRHLSASLIAEFLETLKEKFDVFFRTKIQNWADKTPAQPLPNALRALHDHKADLLKDTVKVESEAQQTKTVKIPMKVHKVAAKKGDETSDETKEKPRIIGFTRRDETSDETSKIKDETALHETRYVNPKTGDETSKKSVTATTSGDYGKCENCGNDFFRNHKIQRFCCDDCRKENWKNKTGKEFDLKIKNKERSKSKKN